MRIGRVCSVAVALAALFGAPMSSAGRRPTSQPQVPVSYVCAMDVDILSDTPGVCPICKMDLQPARIETAWSCPVHAVVMKNAAGQCELDQRDLVPVTISHFWVCPGNGTVDAEPGRCADGQPRQERKVLRAHGDHNARHGGQFFMAGDRWHHLEGTYPAGRLFRLYFYDNFTSVLDPAGISGRVFTREDASGELDPVQLIRSKDGTTLEARIEDGAFPRRVTAKVKFKSSTAEERFDFTFSAITDDRAVAAPVTPRAPVTGPRTGIRSVRPRAVSASSDRINPVPTALQPPAPSSPVAIQNQSPWPGTISDALTVLDIRAREILTLIDQGNFAVVYVPTMLAKDLALAVVDHVDDVRVERRDAMVSAVRRVVLAAWNLDRFGDLGDRSRLVQAHADFTLAVSDMRLAYAGR